MVTSSTASAPWYGTSIVAGAFALLGVILTVVSSATNDWRKGKREATSVQNREVREKCTSFYTELQSGFDEVLTRRFSPHPSLPHPVSGVSDDDFKDLERLSQISARRDAILLTAPGSVVIATEAALDAFRDVVSRCRLSDPEAVNGTLQEYYRTRRDFVESVRSCYELGTLPRKIMALDQDRGNGATSDTA